MPFSIKNWLIIGRHKYIFISEIILKKDYCVAVQGTKQNLNSALNLLEYANQANKHRADLNFFLQNMHNSYLAHYLKSWAKIMQRKKMAHKKSKSWVPLDPPSHILICYVPITQDFLVNHEQASSFVSKEVILL